MSLKGIIFGLAVCYLFAALLVRADPISEVAPPIADTLLAVFIIGTGLFYIIITLPEYGARKPNK